MYVNPKQRYVAVILPEEDPNWGDPSAEARIVYASSPDQARKKALLRWKKKWWKPEDSWYEDHKEVRHYQTFKEWLDGGNGGVYEVRPIPKGYDLYAVTGYGFTGPANPDNCVVIEEYAQTSDGRPYKRYFVREVGIASLLGEGTFPALRGDASVLAQSPREAKALYVQSEISSSFGPPAPGTKWVTQVRKAVPTGPLPLVVAPRLRGADR